MSRWRPLSTWNAVCTACLRSKTDASRETLTGFVCCSRDLMFNAMTFGGKSVVSVLLGSCLIEMSLFDVWLLSDMITVRERNDCSFRSKATLWKLRSWMLCSNLNMRWNKFGRVNLWRLNAWVQVLYEANAPILKLTSREKKNICITFSEHRFIGWKGLYNEKNFKYKG